MDSTTITSISQVDQNNNQNNEQNNQNESSEQSLRENLDFFQNVIDANSNFDFDR